MELEENFESLLFYVFLSEQRWGIFRYIKLACNVPLALRNGQIQGGITFGLSHWWRWAENSEAACLEQWICVLPAGRQIRWHFLGSFIVLKLPLRLQSGNGSFPSRRINWLFSELKKIVSNYLHRLGKSWHGMNKAACWKCPSRILFFFKAVVKWYLRSSEQRCLFRLNQFFDITDFV